MTNTKHCKNCKKKFYSTKGKENCRACINLLDLVPKVAYRRSHYNKIKKLCADVSDYQKEIYILATKEKWGLLNYIDIFRVVHIYMDVVCNEKKYSTKEPFVQVSMMLDELIKLLEFKKTMRDTTRYQARGIVQLSQKGKVIKTFASIKEATQKLDYSYTTIIRACDGKRTCVKEILKWQRDFNI